MDLGYPQSDFKTLYSELISRQGSSSPRRISGASSVSGYYSEDRDRGSIDSGVHGAYKSQHWRYSFRRCEIFIIISVLVGIFLLFFGGDFLVTIASAEKRLKNNIS